MQSRFSLQSKILLLIIVLIVSTTIMLGSIFSYFEFMDTKDEMGKRALETANIVARLPTVINAFYIENPEVIIQPKAEEIRRQIGAEFIVVGNSESIRYSHSDPSKIGKQMVGGDNDRALINGESYISEATGSLGPSLRGKAPIIGVDGEIIGLVSVGFMMEDIKSIIYNRLLKISIASLGVLLVGIIGGIFLTKNIRKDTMGFEPYEVSDMFRVRDAILSSINEGIIAVDKAGRITLMNNSAKKLTGINSDNDLTIGEVFPDLDRKSIFDSNKQITNSEIVVNNRVVIVNNTPIKKDEQNVGFVISFRDKTEMKELVNTLSEVRKYSEDLRAQTHEYTNKLYVISGLLQLGNYREAIELIQAESKVTENQNKILFEQIKDSTIQAILLGKIGLASENKIELVLDENCYLDNVPKHIQPTQLITVIGNLIDNAIEAVRGTKQGKVIFSATDLGNDLIFEVSNNGEPIPEVVMEKIFKKGFSTKNKEGRGYGLAIVQETMNDLAGDIIVENHPTNGVTFSVFIPKKSNGKGVKYYD